MVVTILGMVVALVVFTFSILIAVLTLKLFKRLVEILGFRVDTKKGMTIVLTLWMGAILGAAFCYQHFKNAFF